MRSKLFVPGSRPELFAKAFASAADAVSFDLEDAVAANRKDMARRSVGAALSGRQGGQRQATVVRVNPLDTKHFADDLAAVVGTGLDILNLPKVEAAAEIGELAARLDGLERERGLTRPVRILANIETPRGVRLAAEIAAADRRVIGLQIGFGDLFEPFGISRREPVALNAIRLAVRLAAAEANVQAYDGAFVDVADAAGFRAEALEARQFGFAGKSCIHPTQIAAANEVFGPTEAELDRARRVIAAAETKLAEGVGAFLLDGVMVDGPFIEQARALVALASGDDNV